MKNRLFVALNLSNEIVDEIIRLRKSIYPDDGIAKWESRSKIHITLKFLGEINSERIPILVNNLDSICSNNNMINIEFSHFRIIKNHSIPRILWLGLNKTENLEKLYFEIDQGLSDIGFEKERRNFNPHLTLLRIRGTENISQINSFKNIEVNLADTFSSNVGLFKSELSQTGSIYMKIKSFRLNNGGTNG